MNKDQLLRIQWYIWFCCISRIDGDITDLKVYLFRRPVGYYGDTPLYYGALTVDWKSGRDHEVFSFGQYSTWDGPVILILRSRDSYSWVGTLK